MHSLRRQQDNCFTQVRQLSSSETRLCGVLAVPKLEAVDVALSKSDAENLRTQERGRLCVVRGCDAVPDLGPGTRFRFVQVAVDLVRELVSEASGFEGLGSGRAQQVVWLWALSSNLAVQHAWSSALPETSRQCQL